MANLAIVKPLVELHGGYVRVKSGGIGKGTSFTVHLPLIVRSSEPSENFAIPGPRRGRTNLARRVPRQGSRTDSGRQVDAREFVKRLLEMAGATVSIAGSASEAIERILAAPPDVIVCDLGMPEEDGYSRVRQLRVLEESQDKCLARSRADPYARSEDRTKAIRCGFQNHLAKPVEPAELLAVVSSLAGRRLTTPPDTD